MSDEAYRQSVRENLTQLKQALRTAYNEYDELESLMSSTDDPNRKDATDAKAAALFKRARNAITAARDRLEKAQDDMDRLRDRAVGDTSRNSGTVQDEDFMARVTRSLESIQNLLSSEKFEDELTAGDAAKLASRARSQSVKVLDTVEHRYF